MIDSRDKRKAVVVLPAAGRGQITSRALRAWVARADIQRLSGSRALLPRILDELGVDEPSGGLAALRMWGQTGDRPTAWIAAADPVYLEPELDRLRLHALKPVELPVPDLRRLVDHLQSTLGSTGGAGFARIGRYCYLTADAPLATASESPELVDQRVPTDYLPGGTERAGHRRLLSEIEMALHDHPVNVERESQGRRVINSLWIWGGGHAPAPVAGELPLLLADDPLLRGYWRARQSQESNWPGSVAACIGSDAGNIVVVVPDNSLLEQSLAELKDSLETRRVDELVMLFEDGLRAPMSRMQAYRFWRRDNALLRGEAAR